MIKREMAAKARELWSKYPVLTLTGPRQSGKTTLARSVFPEAEYVNLEDPEVHALALSDMREFLRRHPAPAVFDEVLYAPNFFGTSRLLWTRRVVLRSTFLREATSLPSGRQ